MVEELAKALERMFSKKLVFVNGYLNKHYVFKDRHHAGEVLADIISNNIEVENVFVMVIPCGGVPVGCVVSKRLEIPLDLLVCRKVLIPWNREAGYGAVAPDGSVVLNQSLLKYLGFSKREVEKHVEETLMEIKRRIKLFRGTEEYRAIRENVVVIDDGIASEYTMLAAVKFLRKLKEVKEIIVATPTAPLSSISLLMPHIDLMICLNVRTEIYGFAVADSYREWYDVSDEEVLEYLLELKDLYIPNKLKRLGSNL